MITFRDKTFCYSDCVNTKCLRHKSYIPEDADLPVSWADLSLECPDYKPPKEQKNRTYDQRDRT